MQNHQQVIVQSHWDSLLCSFKSFLDSENSPTYIYVIIVILSYWGYRSYFYKKSFKAEFQYNQKLKNKGKVLPSFPNGWYIALHSHQLKRGGQAVSIDLAGQNMVAFRNKKTGEPYILEAYCKHLGANLGIGGKVINDKCVQCPFHGWLYDGQTGICVDYNGNQVKMSSVEYNDDLGEKGVKLKWAEKDNINANLKKYPVCQMNGYIYVWIHAMDKYKDKPLYPMLNISSMTDNMQYRARTLHIVKSQIQDIPQNGADAGHFKFVHTQVLSKTDAISYLWEPRWKRGDDKNVAEMFTHKKKYIHEFKQQIYKKFFEPYPNKNFLSIGYIDNYVKIPIIGHVFMLNITIIQVGSSTVFIFLKSPFFTCVLFHYLQPREPQVIHVNHETYSYWHLPYWISTFITKMDLDQVSSDMSVWSTKRFANNIYFRKGDQYDQYLKGWREWYSQYYQGCFEKQNKMKKYQW